MFEISFARTAIVAGRDRVARRLWEFVGCRRNVRVFVQGAAWRSLRIGFRHLSECPEQQSSQPATTAPRHLPARQKSSQRRVGAGTHLVALAAPLASV